MSMLLSRQLQRRGFGSATAVVLAGHNKWSKVKHIKAVNDVKKSQRFTIVAKQIVAAVKAKGDNPVNNAALAQALLKAKDINLPKANIEGAIKKGLGKSDEANLEEVVYEGLGPRGSALIVEVLTDKKSRTFTNIRTIFSKNGGSIGTSGQVSWMFHRRGVLTVSSRDATNEAMFEQAIEAGALDAEEIGERALQITCEPTQLLHIRAALERSGYTIDSMETLFVPHTFSAALPSMKDSGTEGPVREDLEKLIQLLEDDDDVVRVAHNHPDEASDSV